MSEELKKEKALKKAEVSKKAAEPELPDLEGARWYDEPKEKIFRRLKSDPEYGLSDADAKVRLGFYGKNKYFKTERMSVGKYLSSMRPEPLTWLFLCVAILYGVFVSVPAAVFITVAIALGYFVLFITGLRAVRILESSSQTAMPTVAVIRGGRRVVISQEQIVPGDVFELEVGDLVPADARLIESDGLVTFEYGVTEAMGDVHKDASFASFRNLRPGACKNLVEIRKLDLDASLSLSHSEKALQVALKTCGETLTLSKKDMNVAVALDGFKEGEAYGLSLKNLRKQIMNSIFAADSGTDYEIDMDTINQICDVVETFTEPKEVSKEYERAYAFLTKMFEKSEMAKDAQISYSKLEVLGEERSGRSQTLTINQYYLVSLLEDYAEAFDNLKGKDLEAVEYVLEDIEEAFSPEESINVDDVAEMLEEAAEALEQLEGLDDVEITYSVCYVEKYLSAVVLGVECKVDEADVDIEGTITVDFGEKPHKTRETIINVDLEGKVEGESAEIVAEVTLDSEKDGDVITYSAELDVEMAIPTLGEENPFNGTVLSGKVEMVLDAGKEKAVITASYDRNEETVDLFTMEFEYSDSKDKLSITPRKLKLAGEEFETRIDVTVSLYREPDKIKANKYTNVL